MDNMAIERILIDAGARVRPLEEESYRPEIVNVLLAKPKAITAQTIPEMIAPAWPDKPYMEVAARLSRPPWDRMWADIVESLLADGWHWMDTRGGRRWFPPEHDSSEWVETH